MKSIFALPNICEGIEVKRQLEIIKGLGLLMLLFVSVSVVAASDSDDSDDIHTVSVTITQTSLAEEGEKPVTNNYFKEIESTEPTNVQIKGDISEDKPSLITNMGEMTTNRDDMTSESTDSVGMPDFKLAQSSPDEFNAALSKWISSMIDDDLSLITIDDLNIE